MVAPASAYGTQIIYEDGTIGPVVPSTGLVSIPQNEVNNMIAAGFQTAIPLVGASDGLTAHAGGGQASALALVTGMNVVSTVATAGDSVRLPPAKPGMAITVKNSSGTSMNVFPATGEAINALGANAAYAVATVISVI